MTQAFPQLQMNIASDQDVNMNTLKRRVPRRWSDHEDNILYEEAKKQGTAGRGFRRACDEQQN
jgi:hypothetical protein